MLLLIVPAAIAAWVWAFAGSGAREALLKALVAAGAATVIITESLSAGALLDRMHVAACWSAVLAIGLAVRLRRGEAKRQPAGISLRDVVYLIAIAGIASIIGCTALLSPPNSADAMAYHLPRVIYWFQARSVAFFPTSYLNQIMLQPVAEYGMLHTYLLSGGDRFVNLIQLTGFLGSIAAVSSIAGALSLDRRSGICAALFCATLPNGILQASGAKNDWLLALWLVSVVYFAVRWVQGGSWQDALFLGVAVGLALGTKATAYLFIPPIAVAALVAAGLRGQVKKLDWRIAGGALLGGIVLINAPQYARNFALSGSILGYDSAQGDGFFRWRNERTGWKPTVSNLLRNTSEQLGARSDAWNRGVYATVLRLHGALGIDPQDPDTTWRWAQYSPPRNANHEADANNRWHLLLLAVAAVAAVFWSRRRKDSRWLIYAAGPAAAFVAFCFYLKWQPFQARLELPLFVAASPLAAALLGRLRPVAIQCAVCLVLVSNARLALLENWTRPLRGPKSLLSTPRDLNYFNDMGQWNNRDSYLAAVETTAASGCSTVGIDITHNQLEYPFQALLLEKNPRVRFAHVGVENASKRYARDGPAPCAVFCPDCAGVAGKPEQYSSLGPPLTIGRFLLFVGGSG